MKINGWIELFFVALAVAGIIWNAATLNNDVKHLKADNAREHEEIKDEIRDIKKSIEGKP